MTRRKLVPLKSSVSDHIATAFAAETQNASELGQTRVSINSSAQGVRHADIQSIGFSMQDAVSSSSSIHTSPMLIPVADVAKLLGVGVRTVWRMVSGNEMVKPIRFRGNVRWNRKDLESWIEAGCPSPEARSAK